MTGTTQIHLPIAAAARDIILIKEPARVQAIQMQWRRRVVFRQYQLARHFIDFTDGRLYTAFPKKSIKMAIRSWTDHREATINDREYYTESWTVLMNIPWVDGQQIGAYAAGKNNRDLEHSKAEPKRRTSCR